MYMSSCPHSPCTLRGHLASSDGVVFLPGPAHTHKHTRTDTSKHAHTHAETHTHSQRHIHIHREKYTHTHRDIDTQRHKETCRHIRKHTETGPHTDTLRDSETRTDVLVILRRRRGQAGEIWL